MKTAAECWECAEKCRSLLSRDLSDEHRLIVLSLIALWEGLARERDVPRTGQVWETGHAGAESFREAR